MRVPLTTPLKLHLDAFRAELQRWLLWARTLVVIAGAGTLTASLTLAFMNPDLLVLTVMVVAVSLPVAAEMLRNSSNELMAWRLSYVQLQAAGFAWSVQRQPGLTLDGIAEAQIERVMRWRMSMWRPGKGHFRVAAFNNARGVRSHHHHH